MADEQDPTEGYISVKYADPPRWLAALAGIKPVEIPVLVGMNDDGKDFKAIAQAIRENRLA